MGEVSFNYFAILVCGVASIIIAALWYGPLFGKKWMELVGLKPEDVEGGGKKEMFFAFIAYLVLAFVLSVYIDWANATTFLKGLCVGSQAWLIFSMITLPNFWFEQKKLGLFWVNSSYTLVSLLVMGVILAVWQ
ncbi:DUF1761 domain-containing protein [candidate division KSB1 bacterium]